MTSSIPLDPSRLPKHIAIIMDGNGRWARKRGLPRLFGHRAGVKAVRKIVEACSELNIGVLTLYAFSTENWARPGLEVRGLMSLLKEFLKRELADLLKNNVRLTAIGDTGKLPDAARNELLRSIEATRSNTGLVLNLALNYGSRQEIVQAVRALLDNKTCAVDEKAIESRLFTAGMPDPDLLIRTSGEMRISNFLLWQIAYTELYFTPVLWPDFKPRHLIEAIADYQKRSRRFGGI